MLRQIFVAARGPAAQRCAGAMSVLTCAAGTRLAHSETPKKNEGEKTKGTVFDVKKDSIAKFLNDLVFSNDESSRDEQVIESKPRSAGFLDKMKDVASDEGFAALTKTMVSLISGKDDSNEEAVRALISKARKNVDAGDVVEAQSYADIYKMFLELQSSLAKTFSGLDFSYLDPTSMFYYLEYEDGMKTPSWKRRMHRYHKGVDVRKVTELNDALYLAHLAYANTIEEVQDGLATSRDPWELIYFQPDSEPGKPSHFLALKKGQSRWTTSLQVVFVVRGTKNTPDLVTDALMVPRDYRGGKAHDGGVRSGTYLVKKHEKLLESLKEMSGKRSIELHLIGHSLGAAAASIAGMEFNDRDDFQVDVVGFGCPALLSQNLSEGAKHYITTVINDGDMIPRMSGATLANATLDIMEYDWTPHARRDAQQALRELQSFAPFVERSDVDTAMGFVDKAISTYIQPKIKRKTSERVERVLYPPGTCIHFYRDGSAISGSYAPCTFFNEIDITRTMMDDHLIKKGYRRLFLDLMRDYHDDAHFKFDAGKELDF